LKLLSISQKVLLSGMFLGSPCTYAYTLSAPANKAIQAFYQYEHWDEDVSRFLQHYESKLTPEEKKVGGWIGFGIKCAINRKIEFIWRFP